MNRVDVEIEKLVTIGNWAKSCKNLDQLNLVKNFMVNYYKRITPSHRFKPSESHKIMYHLGLVDGILLSIEKIKFIKNGIQKS